MKDNHFSAVYNQFIYKSRYSRYLDDKKRRETWSETVARYFDFFAEHLEEAHDFDITGEVRRELEEAVLDQRVMPAMRALMTAGPALKRDHGSVFNCAYLPIDNLRSFDEELYTLMLGTGVGFSVESVDVSGMPVIADTFHQTDVTIQVSDSKTGWAKAFRQLISLLVNGQIPVIDYSLIRPAGARLKTFGGRASGPQPLRELFEFTVAIFKKAAGRRFTTTEAHDLACMVANIVVVGGVRRAALISLSDLSDERMARAKSGEWWRDSSFRRLANNSAIYEEKPTIGQFLREWTSLYESKSGERGIFSRDAARRVIAHSNEFRKKHFGENVRVRDPDYKWGTNPCCVPGGTLVTTKENGVISISDAVDKFRDNAEMHVLAYDEDKAEAVFSRVEAAQATRPNAELLELDVETDAGIRTLRLTPDHQVFTENRGYVRADELTDEDVLVIAS
jgi:ribonucleoside-triphosphate reductase (thioredoxin)